MVNSLSARPRTHDCNPSLESPYHLHEMRYHNSSLTGGMASGVRRTVTCVNTTPMDVTAIFTDGTVWNTEHRSTSLSNNFTIIVKYEATADVSIPWSAVSKLLSEEDDTFVAELRRRIEGDAGEVRYGTKELEFYFIVDITELEFNQGGIWVAPVGVQLVQKKYASRVQLKTRMVDVGLKDFLSDERVSQAETRVSAYVVHDRNNMDNIFLPEANTFVVREPIYDTSLDEGLHIITLGGYKSPTSREIREHKVIPIDEFQKHNIFRSHHEIKAFIERTPKGITKVEVDNVFRRFEEYVKSLDMAKVEQVDPKVESLADRRVFFGQSLKDLTHLFTEVGKFKQAVEKVVNPK